MFVGRSETIFETDEDLSDVNKNFSNLKIVMENEMGIYWGLVKIIGVFAWF